MEKWLENYCNHLIVNVRANQKQRVHVEKAPSNITYSCLFNRNDEHNTAINQAKWNKVKMKKKRKKRENKKKKKQKEEIIIKE